jgi:diphosphomevalonate decarboxylase
MSEDTIKIGWRAPSNIALVKYWGKWGNQIPVNSSLSISLDKSSTTTFLSIREKLKENKNIRMEYYFHGRRHLQFEKKIEKFLDYLKADIPFISDYELVFNSENNFPHSAGIASSASSMSALALCLLSAEEYVNRKKRNKDDFFRRASTIARLGSGSASRSVFGGIVSWGYFPSFSQSSDEFATPFLLHKGSRLNTVRDIILIVSSKEKLIPSSSGHTLMDTHPYREGRKVQANSNMNKILEAIRKDDYPTIAAIVENEALSLHALLISAMSGGLLLQPNTLYLIEEIKRFRNSTGLDLFFTIDAGPNVHLIYYEDQRELVVPFVEQTLSQYCEDRQWIDDKIGKGPLLLTPEIEI